MLVELKGALCQGPLTHAAATQIPTPQTTGQLKLRAQVRKLMHTYAYGGR